MAGDEWNDWDVAYSTIKFAETVFAAHPRIATVDRTNDIEFIITRRSTQSAIRFVILSQYELSMADLYRCREEFPNATAVVNIGEWNHICVDAKEAEKMTGLKVYTLKEFLRRLHRNQKV